MICNRPNAGDGNEDLPPPSYEESVNGLPLYEDHEELPTYEESVNREDFTGANVLFVIPLFFGDQLILIFATNSPANSPTPSSTASSEASPPTITPPQAPTPRIGQNDK